MSHMICAFLFCFLSVKGYTFDLTEFYENKPSLVQGQLNDQSGKVDVQVVLIKDNNHKDGFKNVTFRCWDEEKDSSYEIKMISSKFISDCHVISFCKTESRLKIKATSGDLESNKIFMFLERGPVIYLTKLYKDGKFSLDLRYSLTLPPYNEENVDW